MAISNNNLFIVFSFDRASTAVSALAGRTPNVSFEQQPHMTFATVYRICPLLTSTRSGEVKSCLYG